jgi:hypothetical protein
VNDVDQRASQTLYRFLIYTHGQLTCSEVCPTIIDSVFQSTRELLSGEPCSLKCVELPWGEVSKSIA